MSSKKSKNRKATEKPQYDSKGWEVNVSTSDIRLGHDKDSDTDVAEMRFVFTTRYKGKVIPNVIDYTSAALTAYVGAAVQLFLATHSPDGEPLP